MFDPFGNAQFVSGAGVWNTSTWNNFLWGADLSLSNLRFPGQYADAETALNQNWFRDYDPTIGRYIQSDPIGLGAGINTYAYAGEQPTKQTDRNGLQTTSNFRHACRVLGLDPNVASEALHKAKKAAGLGGADNCLFDLTNGNIMHNEECIGNLGD